MTNVCAGGRILYVVLALYAFTMFGYVTDLRSLTQGRATSSLHFSHYAPVPPAVQEEVVAKVKGAVK